MPVVLRIRRDLGDRSNDCVGWCQLEIIFNSFQGELDGGRCDPRFPANNQAAFDVVDGLWIVVSTKRRQRACLPNNLLGKILI